MRWDTWLKLNKLNCVNSPISVEMVSQFIGIYLQLVQILQKSQFSRKQYTQSLWSNQIHENWSCHSLFGIMALDTYQSQMEGLVNQPLLVIHWFPFINSNKPANANNISGGAVSHSNTVGATDGSAVWDVDSSSSSLTKLVGLTTVVISWFDVVVEISS